MTENDGNIITAICYNCSKQFKSIRAISMHLKLTGGRHVVNFIDHRNYDKNTGMVGIKK